MTTNGAAEDTKSPDKSSLFSHLRRVTSMQKTRRRISCKLLGEGECHGWLLLRVSCRLRDKWVKYWFVLTKRNLYYYTNPDDDSYVGRFNLSGFQVSPIDNERSSKFTFRLYHPDHRAFYMASDRQPDMAKWMNCLAMATLVDTHDNDETNGCHSGDEGHSSQEELPFNCSVVTLPDEYEDLITAHAIESPTDRNGSQDLASPNDEFKQLVETLRRSHISVLGDSLTAVDPTSFSRETLWPQSKPSSKDNRMSGLHALQRTLKDKEQQLAAINDLLCRTPITSSTLTRFKQQNPPIVNVQINVDYSGPQYV